MLKLIAGLLLFSLTVASVASAEEIIPPAGLKPMSDQQMSDVSGQALFTNDLIKAQSLEGAITQGESGVSGSGSTPTDYNFYRMGLNGKMDLNLNVAKFQLGCGGVNDALPGNVPCDIDVDYLRLMGSEGSRPAGYGNYDPSNTEGVESTFSLQRPFVSLAIKNDHSTTLREVVGIKIGAQNAKGALSAGRIYEDGEFNQEHGNAGETGQNPAYDQSPLNYSAANGICDSGASYGNGTLACHSGINSISGFLGAELSAALPIQADVCITGLCWIPVGLSGVGCAGRLTNPGGAGCKSGYNNKPLFLDISGTRLNFLRAQSMALDFNGSGLSSILNALGISDIYAGLYANTRLLHFITINSEDFGLSFQREKVAWPNAAKTPLSDLVGNNPVDPQTGDQNDALWDACGQGNSSPGRCSSAYSVTANSGWWMNLPSVKLRDVETQTLNLGKLGIEEALGVLGAPGIQVNNPNLGLEAAKNCYGSARFC